MPKPSAIRAYLFSMENAPDGFKILKVAILFDNAKVLSIDTIHKILKGIAPDRSKALYQEQGIHILRFFSILQPP